MVPRNAANILAVVCPRLAPTSKQMGELKGPIRRSRSSKGSIPLMFRAGIRSVIRRFSGNKANRAGFYNAVRLRSQPNLVADQFLFRRVRPVVDVAKLPAMLGSRLTEIQNVSIRNQTVYLPPVGLADVYDVHCSGLGLR